MSFRKRFVAATPLICVIIFLLLGFCKGMWHPGWVVFLAIPVVPVILGVKRVSSIYPLFCGVAYVVMGACWNLWHPGWIIFLTIPVVEILFGGKRRID